MTSIIIRSVDNKYIVEQNGIEVFRDTDPVLVIDYAQELSLFNGVKK